MSAIIIPALAIGGVYILYDSMTKKDKDKYRSDTSSSKYKYNSYFTRKHKKHHKTSKTKSNNKSYSRPSSSSSSSSSSFKDINIRKNIIKKNITKKNKENTRIIYAYFTYGSNKNKKWRYKSLPEGWLLKQKTDIMKNDIKYTKLNTFSGPKKNRDALRKYLEKAFEYLKKKNIVKYYKITNEKLA